MRYAAGSTAVRTEIPSNKISDGVRNMKLKINYGTEVGVFPASRSEHVRRASVCDLRVLWMVCAQGGQVELAQLCAFAGASEDEVISSLSYWRGAGVLSADDGTAEGQQGTRRASTDADGKSGAATAEPTSGAKNSKTARGGAQKSSLADKQSNTTGETYTESAPARSDASADNKGDRPLRAQGLPIYNSDELSGILEQNSDYEKYIGECQRIMGKMFNVHEVGVLIGLVDYLDLDFEYVMILLTYCVSHGKKTLHYVEKTAFGLYDAGITSTDELTAELKSREAAASAEGQIRKIFGIGTRALTTKEKKEISSWISGMGCSIEMIQKAYEVTADATGSASLHYANSVLERWHAEGLTTLDMIAEAEARYEAEKASQKVEKAQKAKRGSSRGSKDEGVGSSFDTDEFFNAAVRRSLGGQDE